MTICRSIYSKDVMPKAVGPRLNTRVHEKSIGTARTDSTDF